MRRISFDFMARRLKQKLAQFTAREAREQRNKPKTADEMVAEKKRQEWYKRFIPKARLGPGFVNEITEGDSRQVRRRKLRMIAFADMTRSYPGELRKYRRRLAFTFIKNHIRSAAAA